MTFNLNLTIIISDKVESNPPLLHLQNLGQRARIALAFVAHRGVEPLFSHRKCGVLPIDECAIMLFLLPFSFWFPQDSLLKFYQAFP